MLIHELKLLYLHPAKTGGTSIESAFLEFIYKKNITQKDLSLSERHRIHCYVTTGEEFESQHQTFNTIKSKFPYIDSWTPVISVRHPYDRIISEFKYQLDGFGYHSKMANSIAHKNKDINLAIENNSLYECAFGLHKVPMSDYYLPNAHILKLENLYNDWENLQKKLNIVLPKIRHLNKSSNYNLVLNNNSKQMIYERFKDDFILYKYEP